MKQNRKKGLKWITFSTIIFYTILLIGILWFLQVFFIDDFYVVGKDFKIENKIENIHKILYENDYQEQINQIIKHDSYCVMVFEQDKMIYATSGTDGTGCPTLKEDNQEIQKYYDELLRQSKQSNKVVKNKINSTELRYISQVSLSVNETKGTKIKKTKYYSMK